MNEMLETGETKRETESVETDTTVINSALKSIHFMEFFW